MAEILSLILRKYQTSLDKQHDHAHDRVLFVLQNRDVRCHSNKMMDKGGLEVEDLSLERDNFRRFENVMTQGDGKHQSKRSVECGERFLKDFRAC